MTGGRIGPALLVVLAASSLGCSIQRLAVRTLSETLVGGDINVFASDDDPDLVGQALPFALKTLEALLAADPENADLLLDTCSSFTQYTFAFSELEAEYLAPTDFRAARREKERATRLYLRARDYCLRALDEIEAVAALPGQTALERLRRRPEEVLDQLDVEHVPVLFWSAASWGSAISTGRHRTELIVDLEIVRLMLHRCLALDPNYDRGLIHDALVSLEALPAAMGGSYERARNHYDRAVELNGGQRAGSHLNWAWLVTIARQDRKDFDAALDRALAVDVEASPADRLANTVNQEFARFLRSQADELFLDEELDEDFESSGP